MAIRGQDEIRAVDNVMNGVGRGGLKGALVGFLVSVIASISGGFIAYYGLKYIEDTRMAVAQGDGRPAVHFNFGKHGIDRVFQDFTQYVICIVNLSGEDVQELDVKWATGSKTDILKVESRWKAKLDQSDVDLPNAADPNEWQTHLGFKDLKLRDGDSILVTAVFNTSSYLRLEPDDLRAIPSTTSSLKSLPCVLGEYSPTPRAKADSTALFLAIIAALFLLCVGLLIVLFVGQKGAAHREREVLRQWFLQMNQTTDGISAAHTNQDKEDQ